MWIYTCRATLQWVDLRYYKTSFWICYRCMETLRYRQIGIPTYGNHLIIKQNNVKSQYLILIRKCHAVLMARLIIPQKQYHLFFCLLLSISFWVCSIWNLKQKDKIQIIENIGVWKNKITFSLNLRKMVHIHVVQSRQIPITRELLRGQRVSLWDTKEAFIGL